MDHQAEVMELERRSASSSDSDGDWRACVEYETKRVRVGALQVLVFQMEELPVAASLFMLAEMDANETEISGKRLWTGSHFLARYLWQNPESVRGKRVLELGAGTGICSIVAAKLGAERCVATDGDAEVVDLLDKNVQVNEEDARVTAHSLFWGDAESTKALLERIPDAFSTADVVLAGDVLYKSELLPLLFSTVSQTLNAAAVSGRTPAFLLCHIPRADVTHERVQEQIRESGLTFEEMKLTSSESDDALDLEECPPEDVERARLYYITKA